MDNASRDASTQAEVRRVANPDDPPVPPRRSTYATAASESSGAPGRVAIVQGQVYIVGAILIAQLFLCTTALFELLSGNKDVLWGIAAASLGGFLVALLVTLWPRRRSKGY
jgi:hypothetical protein